MDTRPRNYDGSIRYPYLRLYVKRCRDKCDCWQVVVERVFADVLNRGFIKVLPVWHGTRYQQPTVTQRMQIEKEFDEARVHYQPEDVLELDDLFDGTPKSTEDDD